MPPSEIKTLVWNQAAGADIISEINQKLLGAIENPEQIKVEDLPLAIPTSKSRFTLPDAFWVGTWENRADWRIIPAENGGIILRRLSDNLEIELRKYHLKRPYKLARIFLAQLKLAQIPKE